MKILRMFLIAIAISATMHMTYAMFLVSKGAKRVCFNEPYLWISIPEVILGVLSIIYLFYFVITTEGGKK